MKICLCVNDSDIQCYEELTIQMIFTFNVMKESEDYTIKITFTIERNKMNNFLQNSRDKISLH